MTTKKPVVTERVAYDAEELEAAVGRFTAQYLQPIADRNGAEPVAAVMERMGEDMISVGVLSYLRAGCGFDPLTGTEEHLHHAAAEEFIDLMTKRSARECSDDQWSALYRRAVDIAAEATG
ncbi:hypothetical protein GTW37_14005 [Streptomyces sp. SID4931]|nr:hypothetical protein [Streptomyces sp. SID4931]SCF84955.1 hypothetical protein GA0115255_108741 [Streptomyces sp. Ncost-T6T-2b]